MHQVSPARDTSAKRIPPNSFSGLFVVFLFQLALLCSCPSEHQQLQSISSRQVLWPIFPCVRVRAEYNRRRNGVNGSTGEKRERNRAKGTRGVNYLNTITALTTSIHHLHLPSATVLNPTSGTGFPARSARRSVIPKRPLPALSGNPKRRSEQPSLPSRASSSSPSAPTHLQLQPPQVGGELALTPPLPRASGEVNKSPGTPSWPLSK